MNPFDYGTLHDSFLRTVAAWGERPAYAVPPIAGRDYHPDGKEYSWRRTADNVAAMRERYERFGLPSIEMWAMSETGRLLTDDVEPRRIDTRAFGRAVPGLEARIVGDDDRELPGRQLEKKPKEGVN